MAKPEKPKIQMPSSFNECATSVHNCDANTFCNNTDGSYNCTCSPRYAGNGTSCIGKSSYDIKR